MPLYDYKCKACKRVHESVEDMDTTVRPCPKCGGAAHRIISCKAIEDDSMAPWIRDIVGSPGKPGFIYNNELVKNKKQKPIESRREFKNYLKEKGIVLIDR